MMGETKKDRIQLLVRRFFLFLTDTFLLNACVYLSLIMRFDVGIVSIEPQYISNYLENMLQSVHDNVSDYILAVQTLSQSVAVCEYS